MPLRKRLAGPPELAIINCCANAKTGIAKTLANL
jgi:hypothetical protein